MSVCLTCGTDCLIQNVCPFCEGGVAEPPPEVVAAEMYAAAWMPWQATSWPSTDVYAGGGEWMPQASHVLQEPESQEWSESDVDTQYAVLDSNVLLDHFDALQYMLTQVPGMNLVVPLVVLNELQALGRLGAGAFTAQRALDFVQEQVDLSDGTRCSGSGDTSVLVIQERHEEKTVERLADCGFPPSDRDGVLACAQYFVDVAEAAIPPAVTLLLTADSRLQMKAAACGIPAGSFDAFLQGTVQRMMPNGFNTEYGAVSHDAWAQCPFGEPVLDVRCRTTVPSNFEYPAPSWTATTPSAEPASDDPAAAPVHSFDLQEADDMCTLAEEETSTRESTPHREESRSRARETRQPNLVLRGLPFSVTEVAVRRFLRKHMSLAELAEENAVVLVSEKGRPSGFAEIYLAPAVDSNWVKQRLHMQHLGERYIEALPPKPARITKKVAARDDARNAQARWKQVTAGVWAKK